MIGRVFLRKNLIEYKEECNGMITYRLLKHSQLFYCDTLKEFVGSSLIHPFLLDFIMIHKKCVCGKVITHKIHDITECKK